jgi:hypothetical protein
VTNGVLKVSVPDDPRMQGTPAEMRGDVEVGGAEPIARHELYAGNGAFERVEGRLQAAVSLATTTAAPITAGCSSAPGPLRRQ